jgi:predicted GNAT family acetyltransferase
MQITDQGSKHRYELSIDGRMAGRIDYRLRDGNVIDLVHTEIEPGFEGRGLASKIAQFALDDARTHGRKVIATCEYIADYVGKHPEYRDLLLAQ